MCGGRAEDECRAGFPCGSIREGAPWRSAFLPNLFNTKFQGVLMIAIMLVPIFCIGHGSPPVDVEAGGQVLGARCVRCTWRPNMGQIVSMARTVIAGKAMRAMAPAALVSSGPVIFRDNRGIVGVRDATTPPRCFAARWVGWIAASPRYHRLKHAQRKFPTGKARLRAVGAGLGA